LLQLSRPYLYSQGNKEPYSALHGIDSNILEESKEKAMKTTLHKRTWLWVSILMLVFAVGAPTVTMAQGRGRGRGLEKKAGKFKNGHDARDGRWDGRGPRNNRDDNDDPNYDDDDDYRYGRGRNRRNNDDDDNGGYRNDRSKRRSDRVRDILGGVLGRP
jgi:hypothetical protein